MVCDDLVFSLLVFFFFFVKCSAEVIKGNGKLIPQAVKLWVEHYEKEPKSAIVELLTMLFEVTWELFQQIIEPKCNIYGITELCRFHVGQGLG